MDSEDGAIVIKGQEEIDLERRIDGAKWFYDTGDYSAAIREFQLINEAADHPDAWKFLSMAMYKRWEMQARLQTQWSSLSNMIDGDIRKDTGVAKLMKEAYDNFIVAMEFKENKICPDMLLLLARLYLEFNSFEAALSVCKLLVESYAQFKHLNMALFYSAIATKALGLHAQSASYFSYLQEQPPYGIKAYVLLLLAAREYEFCVGSRDDARNAFTEAYRLMISKRVNCASEKSAHYIHKNFEKSENERIQIWYMDKDTWHDIAETMTIIDFPTLIVDAYEQALTRHGGEEQIMLVNLGLSYYRSGNTEYAEYTMEKCLKLSANLVARYFLGFWRTDWKTYFEYEDQCIRSLQRVGRGMLSRKRTQEIRQAKRDVLHRRCAIVIQCSFRICCARKELKKRFEIRYALQIAREAMEAQAMATEDNFIELKHLNKHANILQSLHPILIAKNIKLELREQRRKFKELAEVAIGNSIARMYRIYFHRIKAFCEQSLSNKLVSAICIQKAFRAYVCKTILKRLRIERQKQEMLLLTALGKRMSTSKKSTWQAWVCFVGQQKRKRKKAASRIQVCYRRYVDRKKYKVAMEKHAHMNDLMRKMIMQRDQHCTYKCFKALVKNRLCMRKEKMLKSIIIQRVTRGYFARIAVRKIRSRSKKCDKLVQSSTKQRKKKYVQRTFEAFLVHLRIVQNRKTANATKIQARVRGMQARRKCDRKRKVWSMYGGDWVKLGSLHVNQKLIYSWLAIRHYGPYVKYERNCAAIMIQKIYRGVVARRAYLLSVKLSNVRKCAAKILNSNFNRNAKAFFEATRKLRAQRIRKLNKASSIISSFFKKILFRKNCAHLVAESRMRNKIGSSFVHRRMGSLKKRIFVMLQNNVKLNKATVLKSTILLQRQWRRVTAQRSAKKILGKKSLQAKLLSNAGAKPKEYCFRKWQSIMIEKALLQVRSSSKTSSPKKLSFSTMIKVPSTLEAAKVPSMAFYTLLNRVRSTGLCHLPSSHIFDEYQLSQLLNLCTCLVSDSQSRQPPSSDTIFRAMQTMPESPLQKLIIYNSSIDVKQLSTLGRCISTFNLVSVVLGATYIGNPGAIMLASYLITTKSCLKQLVLDKCSIGNPGVCALTDAISTHRSLEKLDLNQNPISDLAAKSIANLIMSNISIKVLGFSNSDISDFGIRCYLADAISHAPASTCLETIYLSDASGVTKKGKKLLEKAVKAFVGKANKACEMRIELSLGLGDIYIR